MEKLLSNLRALDVKSVFTDEDMINVLDRVGDIVDHFGSKEITPIEPEIDGNDLPEAVSVIEQDIRLLTQAGFAKKYTVKEMRDFAKSIDVPSKGLREKALVAALYEAVENKAEM